LFAEITKDESTSQGIKLLLLIFILAAKAETPFTLNKQGTLIRGQVDGKFGEELSKLI
jgi:hypothetical protein